ncbi:MAG: hypothetical protein KAQ98_10635 [Bacteriovoracaceae bacterium]|nr:hypothetical protein [Bacteriovoracaceae bacterium]
MSIFSWIKLSIIVFSLFCFCGCSFLGHGKTELARPVGVSMDSVPKYNQDGTADIDVKKNPGKDYGPTLKRKVIYKHTSDVDVTKAIGVVLGPGLNRTIAHISLIKSFQRNKVPIHVISGVGMGAVIASFYASGYTTTRIEWIFHNFFNETRKTKPYSKNWRNMTEKYFIMEFKGRRIENLSKTLVLPVLDEKTGRIIFTNRGSLSEALIFNLAFFDPGEGDDIVKRRLNMKIFEKSCFMRFGVDILVGANVIDSGIFFKHMNKDLNIIFSKMAENIRRQKDLPDFYLGLPTDMMALDSIDKVPECLLKSYEVSVDMTDKILEKMNKENLD